VIPGHSGYAGLMIVLVHGVPETADLWNHLREGLDDASVALSMPGFGCPRPEGFGATKDDYVDWLVGELDGIEGPIDLVGHDWGAGLTLRVATAYGSMLRSWAADVANLLHPDYVWHDFAQIWQSPGAGEDFFRDQLAQPSSDQGALFEAFGVPSADAVALAGWANETMASCILDLYRSAMPNCHATWGQQVAPTAARGLVLLPSDDPFGNAAQSADVARMLGARHEVLDGSGHWWALQNPDQAAAVLNEFHATLT
jgi:pimeloyl-ACP methyl ester carboxylesterase